MKLRTYPICSAASCLKVISQVKFRSLAMRTVGEYQIENKDIGKSGYGLGARLKSFLNTGEICAYIRPSVRPSVHPPPAPIQPASHCRDPGG